MIEPTHSEQFTSPTFRFHPSTVEETPDGISVLGHNFISTLEIKYLRFDKNISALIGPKIEREIKAVCDSLHHMVIVPEQSDKFTITNENNHIRLDLHDSEEHFTFPASATIMLPLCSLTLREISDYVGRQIIEKVGLHELIYAGVKKVKVEINHNETLRGGVSSFTLQD